MTTQIGPHKTHALFEPIIIRQAMVDEATLHAFRERQ